MSDQELFDKLDGLYADTLDVNDSLSSMGEALYFDENEAEYIENRLDAIRSLKRKYGVDKGQIDAYLQNIQKEYLNELKYDFIYTDSVIDELHLRTIKDKEYGARPIIRLIQNNIEDKLTDLLLSNEYNENYTFKIDYINDEFTIE